MVDQWERKSRTVLSSCGTVFEATCWQKIFDYKIMILVIIVEHYGKDKIISVLKLLYFNFIEEIKLSLSQERVFPEGWGFAWVNLTKNNWV